MPSAVRQGLSRGKELARAGGIQYKKAYGVVAISCVEQEPHHKDELQDILSIFFLQVGVNEEWIKEATLEDLVQKGIQDYKSV